jgi:hypothetical protein
MFLPFLLLLNYNEECKKHESKSKKNLWKNISVKMKDILIIFCVLLLVLLILSALGGSVRPTRESFPLELLPQKSQQDTFTYEVVPSEEPLPHGKPLFESFEGLEEPENPPETSDAPPPVHAFDNVDTFASF